jgi:uncharacterized protein
MNFIIIHDEYGTPEGNWYPWLKSELEKLGHTVAVPRLPTPENQNLENWKKALKDQVPVIDENTIFIGHSLGATFILNILQTQKAKACYFVAAFISKLNNEQFDSINGTFLERDWDWSSIKSNCENFVVIHSTDDPYVLTDSCMELCEKLACSATIFSNSGHFNDKSGFTSFQYLLDIIKQKYQ